MTAVLLIATMLERKISSLVWSYGFKLLPSHRTSTVGNFSSTICVQLTPTFVGKRADVYDFFKFYNLRTYPVSRFSFSELRLKTSVSCVCVFWSCVQNFRSSVCVFRSSVCVFRSCICGAVAAQQRKWFPKRSIIFKHVYCISTVQALRLRANPQRLHGAKLLPLKNRTYGDKEIYCTTVLYSYIFEVVTLCFHELGPHKSRLNSCTQLKKHVSYENNTCIVILEQTCTFQQYRYHRPNVQVSTAKNEKKNTVLSLRERPTPNFSYTPQYPRQLWRQISGMQQLGLGDPR